MSELLTQDQLKAAMHSPESERGVLGSVLIGYADVWPTVAAMLGPDDFYLVRNRWIWEAFESIAADGSVIDFITTKDRLARAGKLEDVGGVAYLAGLINDVVSHYHAEGYAKIVKRDSTRRLALAAASEIAKAAYQDDLSTTELINTAQAQVLTLSSEAPARHVSAAVAVAEWSERFEQWLETGGIPGLTTGFPLIDRHTHGLKRGELCVMAARPSMGKSALACEISYRQAKAGLKVGVFSLEMTKLDWVERIALAQLNLDRFLVKDSDLPSVAHVTGEISALPMHICDDGGLTVAEIEQQARDMERVMDGLDVIVVDHLGLVNHAGSRSANLNEMIGNTTKGLMRLAKGMNIAVLALCQLSRQVTQRADKAPDLPDLRESGHIEQDARQVWMLHREGYYAEIGQEPAKDQPQEALLIVRKNHNGPRGTAVKLAFIEQSAKFAEWAR